MAGTVSPAASARDTQSETIARRVTIYRDTYGTPHIYGETDADVVFGVAYAQAEDNFWQIEDSYVRALGRASELYGEKEFQNDLLNREMEVVRLSQVEYKHLEPRLKSLCDAYVAGLNFFLARNPGIKPRLIDRFEGWHVLAFYLQSWFVSSVAENVSLKPEELETTERGASAADTDHKGSNGWAIAPTISASGSAMLFLNPHNGYFHGSLPYELHVHSDEGWDFSGCNVMGAIMPDLGHNEALGWTFTVNYPDVADLYAETFDDADNPLRYRYGTVFTFAVSLSTNPKRRYGYLGSSYVAVVEFSRQGVRARSVNVFGQSAHPDSKHYFDQAPLFARGEFKPAWFTLAEIKAHAERSYHPGQ